MVEFADAPIDATEKTVIASSHSNQLVVIYISVLAIILAVTSMGSDDAKVEMISSGITISDTYSFYQAKSIRQNNASLAADYMQSLKVSSSPFVKENSRWIDDRISAYRATVSRYESEPTTGEGRVELLAKARALEKVRDLAATQSPLFDFAEVLIQIAIVLASISMITHRRWVLWLSYFIGTSGVALTINAFTLLVTLPL